MELNPEALLEVKNDPFKSQFKICPDNKRRAKRVCELGACKQDRCPVYRGNNGHCDDYGGGVSNLDSGSKG